MGAAEAGHASAGSPEGEPDPWFSISNAGVRGLNGEGAPSAEGQPSPVSQDRFGGIDIDPFVAQQRPEARCPAALRLRSPDALTIDALSVRRPGSSRHQS